MLFMIRVVYNFIEFRYKNLHLITTFSKKSKKVKNFTIQMNLVSMPKLNICLKYILCCQSSNAHTTDFKFEDNIFTPAYYKGLFDIVFHCLIRIGHCRGLSGLSLYLNQKIKNKLSTFPEKDKDFSQYSWQYKCFTYNLILCKGPE